MLRPDWHISWERTIITKAWNAEHISILKKYGHMIFPKAKPRTKKTIAIVAIPEL